MREVVADNATKSTDLLRIRLESRVEVVLQACRAWKLLIYHLRLCERHLEGKKQQFKSITLIYFAVAVIDSMLGTNSGTSAASALFGVVNAFMTFGFDQRQVHVSDNGLTSITQKSDVCRDDVVIWLDVQEGNCTGNVTAANVAICREGLQESLRGSSSPRTTSVKPSQVEHRLVEALKTQMIGWRRKVVQSRIQEVQSKIQEADPKPPPPPGPPPPKPVPPPQGLLPQGCLLCCLLHSGCNKELQTSQRPPCQLSDRQSVRILHRVCHHLHPLEGHSRHYRINSVKATGG